MRDRKRYPAPDRRQDVGGHALHYRLRQNPQLADERGIVVVFESDGADWSTHWGSIPEEIARDAAVLTYDRAGLGWSEPGPGPRTADTLARELHNLLMKVAPDRRVLLVAHGYGSHLARVFAHRYPFETAGLVLVDPEHESLELALRRHSVPAPGASPLLLRALGFAGSLGLLRLFKVHACVPALEGLAIQPRQREALIARGFEPSVLSTILAEELARPASIAQVTELKDQFEFPVRILSAGSTMNAGTSPKNFPVVDFNRIWVEQAAELLKLSSDATHEIVQASHHHLALHSPDRVLDLIRDTLSDVASAAAIAQD